MLPYGFRPEIPPPAQAGPWIPLLILGAVVLLGTWLWWRQRQVPLPAMVPTLRRDPWAELEAGLGAPDWYARLGRVLLSSGTEHLLAASGIAELLHQAGERDGSGRWQRLRRHWEWATYAGFSGTAAQHREDLAVAKGGLP